VPDVAIGAISQEVIPRMKTGALVMTLDPAAPLDGVIAHRDDWVMSLRIPAIRRCSTGNHQRRLSAIFMVASLPNNQLWWR
jgi:hypothetical protein